MSTQLQHDSVFDESNRLLHQRKDVMQLLVHPLGHPAFHVDHVEHGGIHDVQSGIKFIINLSLLPLDPLTAVSKVHLVHEDDIV